MAIGIRGYQVYFLEPPTPIQVLMELQKQTGLAIGVTEQEEGHITLFHPAKSDWRIEVDWSTDRLEKIKRLMEAIPDLPVPPFSTYPHSITLSLNPRPAPRSYQYLETSLIFVLQELGGQLEKPHSLPIWAGTRWADMPPLGLWETIRDYWK